MEFKLKMEGEFMEAVEALALVSGHIEEELLLRNEYLAAENKILRSKLENTIRFNNEERILLAKIGKRLGIKGNVLLFPSSDYNPSRKSGTIKCKKRFNGMLKYYYRKAA
jgi:hypothetical protein